MGIYFSVNAIQLTLQDSSVLHMALKLCMWPPVT